MDGALKRSGTQRICIVQTNCELKSEKGYTLHSINRVRF